MNLFEAIGKGLHTYWRVAAYHEAGHAVVAQLLGIRVADVSINRLHPGLGRVMIWTPSLYPEQHQAAVVTPPFRWARLLSNEERDAVFTLAGPMAEAKLLGLPLRTLDSINDLEIIHQLVRSPASDGTDHPHGVVRADAKPFFEKALRRTCRVLSRPPVWNAVNVVARKLLLRYTLEGDEVAETVQWALEDRHQMSLFAGGRMVPQSGCLPREIQGKQGWDQQLDCH